MITLIVPTRNRAHTLRLVAPSYFQQDAVSEIIFVSDAGTDDTPALIEQLARAYPHVKTRLLTNASRLGASESRNMGVREASNEYILFCDDDEYLEAGYAQTCLKKLQTLEAGAVSGRRIYLEPGESPLQALRRFGSGFRSSKPFRFLICEYVNAARFPGDLQLPLTNAIILTRKSLLQRYPFDAHYARGNGYREESDFQMNLFTRGYEIRVTNETHSFHLPLAEIRSGGQRTSGLRRLYWSVRYTHYFFGKYYAAYAKRTGLRSPRYAALLAFIGFAIYRETLRPPLYSLAKRILRHPYLSAIRPAG
ncbi:MAG TPA: glycosyltransferase family 2 protein [Steroidobacteraceae bacterium]|nr:glycosyltransferase family 2 protein [Steroidobacteraceae bacterium]